MEVHGSRDNLNQYFWRGRFNGGNLLAHLAVVFLVFVDEPCGVQHMQPILHHHCVGIGNFFLRHLLVCQQFPFGPSAQRTFTHHIDGLTDHTHGAHGMVNPSAAETRLRDMEALTFFTKQILRGHAAVVE